MTLNNPSSTSPVPTFNFGKPLKPFPAADAAQPAAGPAFARAPASPPEAAEAQPKPAEFELLKLGTGVYSGLPYGIPLSSADMEMVKKHVEKPQTFSMLDRIWMAHLDREAVTDPAMVAEGAEYCVGKIPLPPQPINLPSSAPVFSRTKEGGYKDPVAFVRELEQQLRIQGVALDTCGAWAIAAQTTGYVTDRFLQLLGTAPTRVHWRRAVLCFLRVAPPRMSPGDARHVLANIRFGVSKPFGMYVTLFEELRFYAGPGLSDKEAAEMFSASLPLELASYVNKWQEPQSPNGEAVGAVTMQEMYKSFLAAENKTSWLLKDNAKYVAAVADELARLCAIYGVAQPGRK
ncbi:hypothetical protein IWQ57_000274 [Coemansia nantahalensis]|uniref:Uncharacterized protein n=1 Tax=Coemansia nantahalensis TaxID=2789366 RepID=A0ACC1K867_9FUNG|nr:hypothetical protein IWQ57_000274 [Coemansia nantahalensis]